MIEKLSWKVYQCQLDYLVKNYPKVEYKKVFNDITKEYEYFDVEVTSNIKKIYSYTEFVSLSDDNL